MIALIFFSLIHANSTPANDVFSTIPSSSSKPIPPRKPFIKRTLDFLNQYSRTFVNIMIIILICIIIWLIYTIIWYIVSTLKPATDNIAKGAEKMGEGVQKTGKAVENLGNTTAQSSWWQWLFGSSKKKEAQKPANANAPTGVANSAATGAPTPSSPNLQKTPVANTTPAQEENAVPPIPSSHCPPPPASQPPLPSSHCPPPPPMPQQEEKQSWKEWLISLVSPAFYSPF